MGYRRVFGTLSAALIVGSMGQAAPALANEMTDNAVGTYLLAYGEQAAMTKWVLTPCDNGSDNCVKVSQFSMKDPEMKHPAWTGNAYWTVGSWTMTIDWPNILACPDDGPKFTRPVTFAWDAATGKGFRSFTDPSLCTDKFREIAVKMTLTKESSNVPQAPAPAAAPAKAPAPAAAEAPAVPAPAAPGAAESMAPPPAA